MRYPLIGQIRDGQALYRPREKRYKLDEPEAAVSVLRRHIPSDLERELFVALFLDSRHVLRRLHVVSVGSLQASIVHPREVFRPAIRHGAAALILAHNHPSGDPDPSRDDTELTRRLARAGEVIGIRVLDHIVLGKKGRREKLGRFHSMRKEGTCLFPQQ